MTARFEPMRKALLKAVPFVEWDARLAYLTLVESNFDWLWTGISRGDIFGTAHCVRVAHTKILPGDVLAADTQR